MIYHFSSFGKLLITGEYLVLNGAKALAMPVKYRQWMKVETKSDNQSLLIWKAYDQGNLWFNAEFRLDEFEINESNDSEKALNLQQILVSAKKLNPSFLKDKCSYLVETNTDFPMEWGLGSSSSLVANIACWAHIDPFELFFMTSKGSGFDIACAMNNKPLVYQLVNGNPQYVSIDFFPSFHDKLFFVYLGHKQNSRSEIVRFSEKNDIVACDINLMNQLTYQILNADNLKTFILMMNEHEKLISEIIQIAPVKEQFPDFDGAMKSLGAWGGDFILVTWDEPFSGLREYFEPKGLNVIIPFKNMLL
ncbi:MAG: GHMP kinase [Bacteroidales bacterium]|nr:GHMP kinase [Bacteroidales bacterium]